MATIRNVQSWGPGLRQVVCFFSGFHNSSRPVPSFTRCETDRPRRVRCHPRGITMVEALISISITATAGAALLTSIGSAVMGSQNSIHQAVARGMAEQLIDEISAVRFPTADSTDDSIAAVNGSLVSRANFDDIDDYDDWSSRPPVSREGRALGTEGSETTWGHASRLYHMRPNPNFIRHFTREVTVERVEPDESDGFRVVSTAAEWRRVTVRVLYTENEDRSQTAAELSRIFTYVPISL